MNQGAWLRTCLGVALIFAVLAAWIMLSLDDRGCDQLLREVGQARLPDRCWR